MTGHIFIVALPIGTWTPIWTLFATWTLLQVLTVITSTLLMAGQIEWIALISTIHKLFFGFMFAPLKRNIVLSLTFLMGTPCRVMITWATVRTLFIAWTKCHTFFVCLDTIAGTSEIMITFMKTIIKMMITIVVACSALYFRMTLICLFASNNNSK